MEFWGKSLYSDASQENVRPINLVPRPTNVSLPSNCESEWMFELYYTQIDHFSNCVIEIEFLNRELI